MKRPPLLALALALVLACAACHQPDTDITQMIKTAELGTVEYTVRQMIRNSDETWQLFGDRKVLFSVKATLKAGIDLDRLTTDDIEVNGTTVRLTLPAPQILSLNIRPDNIQLAYSKVSTLRANYTQKEYDQILQAGEQAIRNDQSLRQNILADAEANAREFFTILLRSNGFSDIDIKFHTK